MVMAVASSVSSLLRFDRESVQSLACHHAHTHAKARPGNASPHPLPPPLPPRGPAGTCRPGPPPPAAAPTTVHPPVAAAAAAAFFLLLLLLPSFLVLCVCVLGLVGGTDRTGLVNIIDRRLRWMSDAVVRRSSITHAFETEGVWERHRTTHDASDRLTGCCSYVNEIRRSCWRAGLPASARKRRVPWRGVWRGWDRMIRQRGFLLLERAATDTAGAPVDGSIER